MSDPLNQRCAACGEDLRRAFLFALMIECGASTSDLNYCPETEDHEHVWRPVKEAMMRKEET